jgi:hypothetical protein
LQSAFRLKGEEANRKNAAAPGFVALIPECAKPQKVIADNHSLPVLKKGLLGFKCDLRPNTLR